MFVQVLQTSLIICTRNCFIAQVIYNVLKLPKLSLQDLNMHIQVFIATAAKEPSYLTIRRDKLCTNTKPSSFAAKNKALKY